MCMFKEKPKSQIQEELVAVLECLMDEEKVPLQDAIKVLATIHGVPIQKLEKYLEGTEFSGDDPVVVIMDGEKVKASVFIQLTEDSTSKLIASIVRQNRCTIYEAVSRFLSMFGIPLRSEYYEMVGEILQKGIRNWNGVERFIAFTGKQRKILFKTVL